MGSGWASMCLLEHQPVPTFGIMLRASEIEGFPERRTGPDTQIEIGLDMIDVVQHQPARQPAIAAPQCADNFRVLAVPTGRYARPPVKGDDQ